MCSAYIACSNVLLYLVNEKYLYTFFIQFHCDEAVNNAVNIVLTCSQSVSHTYTVYICNMQNIIFIIYNTVSQASAYLCVAIIAQLHNNSTAKLRAGAQDYTKSMRE